jgi:Leucine-rich repeat (LRR) protein
MTPIHSCQLGALPLGWRAMAVHQLSRRRGQAARVFQHPLSLLPTMAKNAAYREAERKIEAAQRSGATELDLSVEWGESHDSKRLTELPESLGQLSQLRSLNLSSNQLQALPDSLDQLTQLQSLNLSSNQFATLPDSLSQLSQLQLLNLSSNQFATLPDSLGQLSQLQSLTLSSNQFAKLPDSLYQLTQLQLLNLSSNQLRALPDSLGQLTQLQSLILSRNRLKTLPDSLGQLTQLRELDLSNNQLTTLPAWLSQLKKLQSLTLSRNRLTALPESLGQLSQLRELGLSDLGLTYLPESIASLHRLKTLWLQNNQLRTLPPNFGDLRSLVTLDLGDGTGGNPLHRFPESIRLLKELRGLWIGNCQLDTIPDWLHELQHLQSLHLYGNRLTNLPTSLAHAKVLKSLSLDSNPLNPELAAAVKAGANAVKRYLGEMAKGEKKRYEGKVLILGDGNEGKTCVSRALRDLPFRKQVSTRGVDVVPWKVKHPGNEKDRSKDITLNIWDFEGQEISHQTHQFFLTSQALYLLVFKCRDLFLMDRAEYWLDTIRARAPKAKVVIVISQCEERSPHVPLDRLEAQYKDMLAEEWFFAVGCENGKNIERLREVLRHSAAGLEHMGTPWPRTYEQAETALKKKAKTKTAHLTRKQLNAIFHKAGVSPDNNEGAAGAMECIGAITQFADCPDLNDFVVIKPQWLTKAISKVMEDGSLSDDKGEIELKRMELIWKKAKYDGMFAVFHDCMKEFELCYDLEDQSQACLVPLRFGYVPPAIPWSAGHGIKTRRMEYKLNIRPPMGIMSRFIVKTHHMIVKTSDHPKGVYWHNGVFLRTPSPVPSEALCEFIPDERLLRVEVRAAFPQALCEQIHGYVQAVFSFFGGLSAERSFGCIKLEGNGQECRCKGLHTEKRIYTALANQREVIDCEFEDHPVDPRLLVGGFGSFGDFLNDKLRSIVREEMNREPEWARPFVRGLGTLIEWTEAHSEQLHELIRGQCNLSAEFRQQLELKMREYLAQMNELLDDREATAAPGIISIRTKDRSPWNPVSYFKKTYVITPYCESDEGIHACEDGCVEFTRDRVWWRKTAPWIARGTKLLSAGLQIGLAGMPLAVGSEAAKHIDGEIKLMAALGKHLALDEPLIEEDDGTAIARVDALRDLRGQNIETRLARVAVTRLLEETAPDNYHAKSWGGLRRIRMPDNSHRWLCGCCAEKAR